MQNNLNTAKHIHFIGIGGIGISAIARMLLLDGKKVTGSDRSESEITEELRKAGAKIFIGHDAKNISAETDLVIYTVAIGEDNPELVAAKERDIALLTYPETLQVISREKYTIAISGTHGKTTVTAMTAGILIKAGLKPTVLVGSLMKDPGHSEKKGTNFIPGSSNYFVVEADEYRKSFHNLSPSILVINNLDEDHLDFYKDLADIQTAFREVANRIPKEGFLICNVSDPHLVPVISGLQCSIIDYKEFSQKSFNLQIPGDHNRSNAAAAYAVGRALEIKEEIILSALHEFTGIWRRFEYKGETQSGSLVYDDYAHNPAKVKAALQGAHEKHPDKKIKALFQPHLYSRTKFLLNEFAKSFNDADEVIIAPIYAAREEPDVTISSGLLAEATKKNNPDKKVAAMSSFEEIKKYCLENFTGNDVIIIMSAGDMTELCDELVNK